MRLVDHPLLKAFVALVALFIIAPIAVVVWISFSAGSFLTVPPPGYSLRWFQAFLEREEFLVSLRSSLVVGVLATVLGVVIGTLAAYGMFKVQGGAARAAINLFFFSPLIFPEIVIAIALLLFLSERRLAGGMLGLVLAQLVIIVPLTMQTVNATLAGYGVELEEAAASLGAGPARIFLTVTLPLIKAGVAGAAIFAFLFSFNDAVLAVFLRGPDLVTLPVQMFAYIRYQINPLLGAVSVVFIGVTIVVIVVFDRLVGFESIVGLDD
ncbi:MAG: ABC transporter permease [Thermomicrobiales bacterium]|nr:ABC transporter permease [Thermomicrobiales bacterium]